MLQHVQRYGVTQYFNESTNMKSRQVKEKPYYKKTL